MLITLLAVITLAIVCFPSVSYSGLSYPAKYDRQFKASASRYLPLADWKLLKAQCYQESRLQPLAESPVGAQGICQFMPNTWSEMPQSLQGSAWTPNLNIDAAAYYMARLRKQWSTERPEFDRHSLAMASYNAGLGNLLKAQQRCDMAVLYSCVIDCLPDVTGRHSKETIDYVQKIWWYWVDMKL